LLRIENLAKNRCVRMNFESVKTSNQIEPNI